MFKKAVAKGITKIVAMATSRFIRNEKFDAIQNPNAVPSHKELKWLKNITEEYGVQLMTIADPDLSPRKDAAFIGVSIKQNEGIKGGWKSKKGPGYKMKQKQEWFAEVCRLHYQNRWSTRRIAEHVTKESGLKISREAIRVWIKESEMECDGETGE